jgi:hypothetical protein
MAVVMVSGCATPEQDAIDVIISNKAYILDKLEKDSVKQSKSVGNLFQLQNDTMLFYLKKLNKQNNKGDTNFIAKYFWCQSYLSTLFTGTPIITDTINIRFLSNLLRSKNSDISRVAMNTLSKKTAFSALEANSAYIKRNLKESPLSEYFKLGLLCFLLPDANEKKMIVVSPQLQFHEKAVVDDVLLDSLILIFKKDTTWLKSMFEGYLLNTGKKRAVKAVLENLSNSRYEIVQTYENNVMVPCTSSYRRGLLSTMRRYYPHELLFDEEALPYLHCGKNYEIDLSEVKTFWIRFRAWVLKNYSVTLQDSLPYSYYFDGCQQPSISRHPKGGVKLQLKVNDHGHRPWHRPLHRRREGLW